MLGTPAATLIFTEPPLFATALSGRFRTDPFFSSRTFTQYRKIVTVRSSPRLCSFSALAVHESPIRFRLVGSE
jgi:hypothetical protein